MHPDPRPDIWDGDTGDTPGSLRQCDPRDLRLRHGRDNRHGNSGGFRGPKGVQERKGPKGGAVAQGSSGTSATQGSSGTSGAAAPTGPASMEMSYISLGWNISGTLYKASTNTPTKAVILVPMRGFTRDSYPISFITDILGKMDNTIVFAIDPRGTGKSTNLGNYQSFTTDDYRASADDIITARTALRNVYPTLDTFYVVGASMGSSAAILAANKDNRLSKVVMISPGRSYEGVSIDRAVSDYMQPVLAVASSGDTDAATAAQWVYSTESSPQKQVKIYRGTSAHGTDIFGQEGSDTPLSSVITDFLK